jgi:hypothetical protein
MSKKLLSEAQVRRFQNLACIKPLHEMESLAPAEEEVPMEGEEEMEMDADETEVELDAAEAVEEADVEIDEELVQQFTDAVSTIQQVADALGGAEEADVDVEEEPIEMDAAPEAPELGDEDAGADLEGEEEELELKELVKIVAQRVAKRLQEAKRAQSKLNKALGKK